MSKLRFLAAIALLAALSGCGSRDAAPAAKGSALTEDKVRAVVDAMEAASKTLDAQATAAVLSDDVVFVSEAVPALGTTEKHYTRAEVIDAIGKEATLMSARDYSSKVEAVRIAPDGRSATADLAVHNAYTMQGHQVVEDDDQTCTLELRDGQLKVVRATSRTTHLTIDGQKRL